MIPVSAVILSAGLGTRMNSKRIKILHPLAGKPMILHLLDRIKSISIEEIIMVIGYQRDKVEEMILNTYPEVKFVYQDKQMGTGHALLQTEKLFTDIEKNILVLNGDTPFISEETLISFIKNHDSKNAALSVLTAGVDDPTGYGRVVYGKKGKIQRIIEEKDATPLQRRIKEINTGIYLFKSKFVFEGLHQLTPRNAQNEYYLTDIIALAVRKKQKIEAVKVDDPGEVMGINDRIELSKAEAFIYRQNAEKWMQSGVTLIDPDRIYIDQETTIGRDTVIYPGVFVKNGSSIGEDCTIFPNVVIANSQIKNSVLIKEFCVITDSVLEEKVTVGPFAHIRPGSIIRKNAYIGNFVEIKKSEIGEASKANHLSYLGDAVIGKRVNVGAGTITCNYDGVNKYQTVIGDDVFIGSDTQFIAPVTVESGSLIGAGSTIVENIPKGSLSLSRAHQIIKKGWMTKKRNKDKKLKKGK